VTTLTDHGLVCLDGADYGAVALALQADALAVEAALDSISDSFDSFYLRPVVLAATTTLVAQPSSGEQVFGMGPWAVAYSNFVPAPTTAASSGARITIPRTGWYAYGGYANMIATGAVTALSRRTLYANATRTISGVGTVLSQVVWRTVDTGTGGEFLTAANGTFYATAGNTVDVQVQFSHTNAASTVGVQIGAKLWCHFIGSGVEIGSA
jgi:hypothetical protein